ncbi:MAG: hypothetical protein HWN71_05440 [Desulfobacterales bacterium]|nr:hypothetical protein [Desulfobacterales bacterium]
MKITIIGAAGTLGSCTTFNLIVHSLANEILMIDTWENMLKAHYMDLNTAATGKDVLVRTGGYEEVPGSDVIIITAGAPSGVISSRMELLPNNLPIVRDIAEKINQFCPDAVVIIATNPVGPLNYAMYLLSASQDRRKFIGYSLNDSIRFQMMAAEALGVPSRRVDGMVIGEHGGSQVMLFSSLRVDGKPVTLSEDFKRKIRERVPNILRGYETLKPKRTAGWTSAIGLADVVRAIGKDTGEIIPCSVVIDGEYGYRNLSMTVPAILGRGGVQGIQELELAPGEQEGLKVSVGVLKEAVDYIEKDLGMSGG